MARDITVTFDDDSQHVYQGAPDNVTPTDIESRAQKDFGKKVKALDGGRRAAEPAAPPKPETEIPTGVPPAQSQAAAAAPAQAPGMMGFLTGAPRAGMPQAPGMGMLGAAARATVAPVETGLAVGSGMTTGPLAGLLQMGNRVAQQVKGIFQGQNADEIKASGPSAGEAFERGMQAGTYQPSTPEAQQQTEAIGNAMQTHGPALLGVGPEIGAMGKILGGAARSPQAAALPGKIAAAPVKAIAAITPELAPETQAVVQKATKFGIDLPPDAFSKNKFAKIAGEASRNVPLSGAGNEANATAFNSTLARRIGAEGAEKITPKVFDAAITKSGDTIGRITGENDVPVTALRSTIDDMREASAKRSEGVAEAVEGYLKDIEAKADENGVVPGAAMQQIVSDLGRDARSSTNGNIRNALGELHGALTGDVAKLLTPEDAQALRKAKQQYSDALTIAPLVRPSGDISPSGFNQAFRSTRAGKMRAAKGTGGEMGDLAEVSQYMREPGSSLTAERGVTYAALGGAAKIEPHTAAAAYASANAYNRLGPKVLREKSKLKPTVAPDEAPPAEPTPPPAGGPGPGPETPSAPTDPRLAEIAKLREGATDPAVQAALDAHEKTVQADLKTKAAAAKQAASVDALEAAAKATQDPDLRATLQKQADKLRAEKIPVGEATELAGTPTPKPEKVGKIPVGKVVEGQPALPVEKAGPIPAGQATEITPEVITPEEPIPVGEATDVSPVSNRPAAEVVSNVPKAEPVSNRPSVETGAPIVNNEPVSEYSHGALFKAAEHAGIETRGRRPAEVRAAFEKSWAKEHGLNPMDAERAKNVAQALNVDEAAVEAAAKQHEKSPRAFDRAIDDIIQGGTENAFETHEAANSGEGPAPNPPGGGSGKGSAGTGRGGNANVNPERAGNGGSNKGNSNASGAAGPVEATAEQPGPNSPATTGTHSEVNQPGGSASETIPVGEVTEGAPETHAANNASGESEASSEAINRAAREKAAGQERVLIDRDGTVRPLIGPSAVDQVARPGQVVAQRGVGAKEWTVLSSGADMTKGGIARALSKAEERPGTVARMAAERSTPSPSRTATEWATEMSRLRESKPRPLEKLYGKAGPTDYQRTEWEARQRRWQSEYNRASKMQKQTLAEENAERKTGT